MGLIKGITITLYEKTQTGTDVFNAPTFTETPTLVQNVLVSPVSSDNVTSSTDLNTKRAQYELCIPKADNHIWENSTVEFFGEKWHTVGFTTQLIDSLVPLAWNKKIKVERYG